MEYREELRDHILQALELIDTSDEIPPFSMTEMVVMACIAIDEPIETGTIFTWIMEHSYHYRKLSYKTIFNINGYRGFADDFDLWHSFVDVFYDDKVPLEKVSGRRHIFDPLQDEWTVSTEAGSGFLRRYTWPLLSLPHDDHTVSTADPGVSPADGSCPFLDLPPELRLTMYEMTLSYSTVTMIYKDKIRRSAERELAVPSQPFEQFSERLQWRYPVHIEDPLPMKHDPLAILLTNNQVHHEAMSIFFKINHFAFDDTRLLYGFPARMQPARRMHLEHISINYEVLGNRPYDETERIFTLLAEIRHLKRLEIHIDGTAFLKLHPARRNNVFGIKHTKLLRDSKARKEVTIHSYGGPLVHPAVARSDAKVRRIFGEEMAKTQPDGDLNLKKRALPRRVEDEHEGYTTYVVGLWTIRLWNGAMKRPEYSDDSDWDD